MALLDLLEALEPRQEVARVVVVLIVLQPFDPGGDDGARFPREIARGIIAQQRRHCVRTRRLEPGAECGEAAVDADLAAADRRLECRARERKRARAGQRAEQHRAERAAGGVRQRLHVEGHQPARGVTAGRQQGRGVRPAVGERDLLGHGEHAMGRRDEQRLVRRDEAALDRARAFHQFGRQHHVDVAGHRHQGQHRVAPGRLRRALGEQLEIIDRGAGALGDPGHRCRLREIAAVIGEIDDPVRQHAAAFAAERNHGDGDRPYLGALSVHRRGQAAAPARSGEDVSAWRASMRRCNQPITAPRTLSLSRSQPVGLAMIEAR